jgi:hypothetical protein
MIRIVRSCVGNIVQYLLSVQSVTLGDCQETHGTEGTFGIDVETLAFATAHAYRELAGYGEGVAKLGFACAKLAEELGDRARFDTAWIIRS